jgi:hypothetical protein
MIDNIIFNYHIQSDFITTYLMLGYFSIMAYFLFVEKPENKLVLFLTLILFFNIIFLTPISKVRARDFVCKEVLSLKQNECNFDMIKKEDKIYHAVYLYGNFKAFQNVYQTDRNKFNYSNSQDQYVVIIMDTPKEFLSSTILDTLRKDKELILKQRDEFFKSQMTKRGL